jgi:hypothetical protein
MADEQELGILVGRMYSGMEMRPMNIGRILEERSVPSTALMGDANSMTGSCLRYAKLQATLSFWLTISTAFQFWTIPSL